MISCSITDQRTILLSHNLKLTHHIGPFSYPANNIITQTGEICEHGTGTLIWQFGFKQILYGLRFGAFIIMGN